MKNLLKKVFGNKKLWGVFAVIYIALFWPYILFCGFIVGNGTYVAILRDILVSLFGKREKNEVWWSKYIGMYGNALSDGFDDLNEMEKLF